MKGFSASYQTVNVPRLVTKCGATVGLCLLLVLGASPVQVAAQDNPTGPNRKGFTLLLSAGLGFQSDDALEESTLGIGGLNAGIGGFLSPRLGLLFRVSGTTVNYDYDEFDYTQTSGVGGIALQYWLSDRFNVEGGPAVGFWTSDLGDDEGFGLLVAAGYSVFQSTKTSLQLGVEWAPAFTEGNVQNLSFNLGFQLL